MKRPTNAVSVIPLADVVPIRAVLAVSSRGFIALWWIVQSLHVMFIVYSASVIKLHRYFIMERMEVTIDYMGPTIIGFFDAVIVGHSAFIVCHSVAFLQSVGCSLYYRHWRFVGKSKVHPRRSLQYLISCIKQTICSTPCVTTSRMKTSNLTDPPQMSILQRLLQFLTKCIRHTGLALFGRFGIFGVEGTYYESSFFAMEVVEISLQIFQAYKLSQLVSRVWINRLNVIVLILNCWSTAFVHQFLHGDRLVKRVVLLVVDGFFDVVSSIVIPLVVIYPYYQAFDSSTREFPFVNYYHDTWLIQAISENRQIFVTSWIDYISKLMPGVTVFGGMLVLKQYVVMDRTTDRISHSKKRVRSTFISPLEALLPAAHTHVRPFRSVGASRSRIGSTVNVLDVPGDDT